MSDESARTMNERLGHRLRVAMVDAQLTQAGLAGMVGLTAVTVGRHMRGETPVDVQQLARYAEALGVRFVFGPDAESVAPATGLEPVTYRSTDSVVAA